ncbi:serine hydrolase domain-containing protein [Amycolatopsis pithecellobii]|uniref:Serine hydrolase n=1 Tax=Amycolatopsis pithecellobii TaxID=664692 RepID=A0A6N7YN17_9PSEU|nr:serine hydrolase domain-containing protein [Amycolatopsis pithecellobii]MTD54365.1 serine hydrolase [Amycolatopsis pithecellobii]
MRRLASASPEWPPGTTHGYHGLTYGWLVGEIVRRAAGTSAGAIFRERIAKPQKLDIDLGTPARQQARVGPILPYQPMKEAKYDRTPYFRRLSFAVDGYGFMSYYDVTLNGPKYVAMEFPSFNATGAARCRQSVRDA